MSEEIYLGLGSNLGDRIKYLENAVHMLNIKGIKAVKKSSYYETKPFGYLNQPDFINMAVKCVTVLKPYELLDEIHDIENKLGRVRTVRWGPRTIDIDILLYDSLHIEDETLEVPHKGILERAFVLAPLFELDNDLRINGTDIKDVINKMDLSTVKLMEKHI